MDMSQSSNQSTGKSEKYQYNRNGFIITVVLMSMTLPSAALFAYFGYKNQLLPLFVPAALLILTFFFDFFPLSLIRQGRANLAMTILSAVFFIDVASVLFVAQGFGLIGAASIIMVTLSIAGLAMTPNYFTRGVAAALVLGFAAVALDAALTAERIRLPQLETYSTYIAAVIAAPILLILLREFNKFNLQVKITLGILFTGGIVVATIVLFGLERANAIVNSLSGRFEANIIEQTEARISSVVQIEAEKSDSLFSETTHDLLGIAEYLSALEEQTDQFAGGVYWNAEENIFQLSRGQYGNSNSDPASIFIPNTYILNERMLADLNTAIHLDFLSPGFLDTHSEVVALYYISPLGYTIYYPNIGLAQAVPPDFDPVQEPFYTIAEPRNNPMRQPRWTEPYQDPAGTGLIVTLSVPVYTKKGLFKGVVGADLQLTRIAESISNIKLAESDFSILLDEHGHILAMPEQGYALFGLESVEIPVNESPEQTVLDTPHEDLKPIAEYIAVNASGITSVTINDESAYLVISSLETTGYKLVTFAPENELNREIVASRASIENDIQTAFQGAALILAILFIGALIVSLWVGQIITRPMKRLTGAVEQIAGGDLTARVQVESQDETGTLARSFNAMADRLSQTLQGLEERIAERTNELEKISQSNAYRAAQFESIARISRTISSTQSLDALLPQIARTISAQLGFYHAGIFLLDAHKEYAVLVAANSEGGQRMLERNHRLRVGETGIVGFATRSGQPRIALDVGLDAVYFNNPDLPETHSEIALPLKIGDEIIGALDVQSTEPNAFSQEDISILSTLADQVSIAIQNSRSYQQSQEALKQAELTARQLSEQQWSQLLKRQSIAGYHFDGVEARQLEASQAAQQENSLSIPLVLRGVKIGALKLSPTDPARTWDEDEIAMAKATAERTALAIENARLLQDAQKRATKERAIGEISAKISNLANLENILQTTLKELGRTLPGTDIAIQFTSENSGDNNRAGE
ncbi:MAG: HAMP domain-containing protein [Anaerolineaceae bacterium]|jgi:GAF domain-containing protein/HAMP domain-containing protein|nr:MAG: HAMP domain-containing protein [Anaerolineaceae bacterium]